MHQKVCSVKQCCHPDCTGRLRTTEACEGCGNARYCTAKHWEMHKDECEWYQQKREKRRQAREAKKAAQAAAEREEDKDITEAD